MIDFKLAEGRPVKHQSVSKSEEVFGLLVPEIHTAWHIVYQ